MPLRLHKILDTEWDKKDQVEGVHVWTTNGFERERREKL
jgi:hypothetical protein